MTTQVSPKAAPRASAVAVVLALALCVVGVVLGRDASIEFGLVDGAPWIAPAIDWLLGVTVLGAMLPIGIVAAVIGLVLLVCAVLPRSRTHRPSGSDGVWIAKGSARVRSSSIGVGIAAVDRLVTALVGLVLGAAGLAAAAWERDRLPQFAHDARRTVESWNPAGWADTSWWPWALTGATVVVSVAGLYWLWAHRPRRAASLIGSDDARVDLTSAAQNAAAALASSPGVDAASGRVVDTGTGRLLRISARASDAGTPSADLLASAVALRETCAGAMSGLEVDTQVLIQPGRAR